MENQDSELDIETLAGDRGERGRSGAGIAWLALLLALAVAAFAGWQWWQERASVDAAAEQAAAVSQLRGELLKLSRRLDDLQSTQDGLQAAGTELARIDAEIAGMAARLDRADTEYGREREKTRDLESEYASLADRVGAMESSIAALAVRGESPGKRIELAEIDFLLRNASERLQLFEDRRGAARALELADAQLQMLDDPLYLPVRQAIATARLDLDAMPVVDRVGLTQRLAHLQSRIPALPFAGETASPGGTAVQDPASTEEASIWARFKVALSGLVTIRRRVDEQDLISIQDKEYVRQGLWLQFESARLALLRSDQAAYGASLRRAADTLEQYFDAGAQQVTAMLEALAELGEADLAVEPPDISAPWSQLNALRDAGPSVAPLPDELPDDGE